MLGAEWRGLLWQAWLGVPSRGLVGQGAAGLKENKLATTYRWKSGSYISANAQAVGDELQRLQQDNGGRLTPRVVVEAARPADSPLHPCIEWDDVRAAELYREDQARHVVRSVRIVTGTGADAKLQRAFVNVIEIIDEEEQHGYVPMARVLSDADLYRQVVEQAAKDLHSWEDRYAQFTELASIGKAARERVEQLALPSEATV